jgi:hypothetical protein
LLVLCRTADDAATVNALMRLFAVFRVVLLWISDRGSHFNNAVVRRVQKELKVKHHLTFDYGKFPVVERHYRVRKQVIRSFRAVRSELKMYADEWP